MHQARVLRTLDSQTAARFARGLCMALGSNVRIEQSDEGFLAALGTEAAEMLKRLDYPGLANRFGYALCYGREPADAIEADYKVAARMPHKLDESRATVVKYFEPNDTGLHALVECVVPIDSNSGVRLELIVTGDNEKHITIEDISGAVS